MDRMSRGKEKISQKMAVGSDPRHSKSKANATYVYVQKKPSSNRRDELLQTGGFCQGEGIHDAGGTGLRQDRGFVSHSVHKDDILSSSPQAGSGNVQPSARTLNTRASQTVGPGDGSGLHSELFHKFNITCPKAEDTTLLPQKSTVTDQLSQEKSPRKTTGLHELNNNSEKQAKVDPFDICLINKSTPFTLKPSLFANNREKRNQIKHSIEGQYGRILRSGMVLLKKFLSLDDQVKIVKACREIGLGTGGFYQPCYRDGGKLHLKMTCLGKNWDPDTGQYGDFRSIDNAKPPAIPHDFLQFVENTIRDSHALIAKNSTNVEDILPWMSPNICLVNFYSITGRLGLHQDKDESRESLRKGLPVVSFSIGDSAEFLYGDERDVDKATKVLLESGDALLFGGKSRHVFHAVASVIGKSAPETLIARSNLRPGRLNLTFREY